jgi:sugar phosphate isomerase/epimerase
MRLGIFARTFAGTDPAPVLAAARAAGFACVQYNMACSGLPAMPDDIPAVVAAAIRSASAQQNVAIAAVSGTYNMIHPDAAVRAAGLRRLGVLIAAAGAMGTGMVTLCTGTRDPDDQWRHHPDNASAARRLIDEIGSPSLAVVLDPANLFAVAGGAERRDLVARAVDLLADRIVMAHAKDRDAAGGFATAGQGVIDFAHFFGCLRAAGFDGDLVTHGLTAAEAPGVAAFLAGLVAR